MTQYLGEVITCIVRMDQVSMIDILGMINSLSTSGCPQFLLVESVLGRLHLLLGVTAASDRIRVEIRLLQWEHGGEAALSDRISRRKDRTI